MRLSQVSKLRLINMDCWTRITRFYTQFLDDTSTVYLTDDISDSQGRFGKATDEMAVKVL